VEGKPADGRSIKTSKRRRRRRCRRRRRRRQRRWRRRKRCRDDELSKTCQETKKRCETMQNDAKTVRNELKTIRKHLKTTREQLKSSENDSNTPNTENILDVYLVRRLSRPTIEAKHGMELPQSTRFFFRFRF